MSMLSIIAASRRRFPQALSPALWFSDVGSSAGQWDDISGNGRHAVQAVSANQPAIITNALNGRQVRRFDGSTDVLKFATPNSLLQNVSGATIFAVRKWDTSPTTAKIPFAIFVNGSNTMARALLGGGASANKSYIAGRRLDADSVASAFAAANINTSAFAIQVGVFDYANSDAFQYINGALDGSNTSFQTNGNTSNTNSNGFSIGATLADTLHANVDIAEILVFQSVLSTNDRQRVESYLSAKYNIPLV